MNKDEVAGHLFEFSYLLGSDKLIQELVCYLSAQEGQNFIEHIHRHYDLELAAYEVRQGVELEDTI